MTRTGYRWLLLGCSSIAQNRVLPALRATGQEVVGALGSDADRAAEYAQRNRIPASGDYRDGLNGWEADAVYISTTNEKHLALAAEAARCGLHVLSEKPLADNFEDSRAIVAACENAGVVLGVNHHLVESGLNRAIRELVRAGHIGQIRAVRIFHSRLLAEHMRGWRLSDIPGAGVVPDIGSHDASLLIPLMDPAEPVDVAAIGVRQGEWHAGSDDAAMSILRFDNDAIAQIHAGFTTPYGFTGVEVLGSAGAIRADGAITAFGTGPITLADESGTRVVPVDDERNPYEIVVDAFANAIAGEGTPTVTGADSLKVQALVAAMEQSASTGTRVHLRNWELV